MGLPRLRGDLVGEGRGCWAWAHGVCTCLPGGVHMPAAVCALQVRPTAYRRKALCGRAQAFPEQPHFSPLGPQLPCPLPSDLRTCPATPQPLHSHGTGRTPTLQVCPCHVQCHAPFPCQALLGPPAMGGAYL